MVPRAHPNTPSWLCPHGWAHQTVSLTLKVLHQPLLLHTTSLSGMALFLKENLMIFHWHSTLEQSSCPIGGSWHIKNNEFYPQINSLFPFELWDKQVNPKLYFQIPVKLKHSNTFFFLFFYCHPVFPKETEQLFSWAFWEFWRLTLSHAAIPRKRKAEQLNIWTPTNNLHDDFPHDPEELFLEPEK